jgi:hypothetical protein
VSRSCAVQRSGLALPGCSNEQLVALQGGQYIDLYKLGGQYIDLYKVLSCIIQEFGKMKERAPENFRVDYAVSREQTNAAGERMYIQTRMAEYKEELWELLKKDNTYVYMCGLKGMEKGIDDIMVSLAEKDGMQIIFHSEPLVPTALDGGAETLCCIYCLLKCQESTGSTTRSS